MKMKTIEQKAKAYDEALKVLHKYDGANIMFTQDLKEEMFPELKESEEERIRKSIIAILKNYVDDSNTFKPKMIGWLEKQGERMSDPRYSILDKLIEADGIYQMAMNDAMVQEAKTKAIDALSKLEIGKLLEIEKQGEQKPAWSEEDETALNNLIYALANDRIGNDRDEYINFLKSLKDKYTWKPSDEQIEALLKLEEMHVLEHEKNQENAHLYMVVKSIREQLLKLREE